EQRVSELLARMAESRAATGTQPGEA
ncbi:MAG: hypothetical protein QOF08_915, partial [Gaiellales bacterium]|nr:hypothetical protein [Gaiellales bacterium]